MLTALVNGVPTRSAPGARGTCGDCQGTMIAKCGQLVTWHWAHEAGFDCDPWSEPESEWHLQWKERFLAAGCRIEVPLQRQGEQHRADVVLPGGWVIELQHDYLPPDAIKAREQFYREVIWLYDAERLFWDRLELTVDENLDRKFRWLHPAKSMLLHAKPLLWQPTPSHVLPVQWLRAYPTGTYGGLSAAVPVEDLPARMIVTEQERKLSLPPPAKSPLTMFHSEEWDNLERLGYETGHVVARCPRCREQQMVAYSAASQPWPRCRMCLPHPAPRLECVSDLSKVVHKRPGQPRTKTQLARDGYIVRPEARL